MPTPHPPVSANRSSTARSVTALQRLIAGHAKAIVFAFAIVSLVLASQLGALRIDGTVDNLMTDDAATRRLNRQAKVEFSDDEVIIVGLDAGRVFDADVVRELDALAEHLALIEGVEEVQSLANIEDIRGRDDDLDASALVDLDRLDLEIERIRERALGHRIYDRNILSPHADALLAIVYLEAAVDSDAAKQEVARKVLRAVAEWPGPKRLHVTGGPALEYELSSGLSRDFALLMPLGVVVMGLLIYWVIARAAAVGLALAEIAWCELATLGFMAMSGIAISTVTSIVPLMALAISATYAIYFLGMIRQCADAPLPGAASIRLLARPAFLSAASTGIGFASLVMLGVDGIDQLGTTLSVAIAAAYAGTMLLLPALTGALGVRLERGRDSRSSKLGLLGVRMAARPWRTLSITAAVVAAAAMGIARLEVSSEPVALLDQDGTVVAGNDFLRTKFGGTTMLRLVVDTNQPDGALAPEVLSFLEGAIARIKTHTTVVRTVSLLDYLYLMDSALRPQQAPRAVPESRELAAQYLLLYESSGDRSALRHYLNYDRSALSVTVKTATQSTEETMAAVHAVERAIAGAPIGVNAYVVGNTALMARALNKIARGMLAGLLTASILICVVMTVILRSPRLALLAMVPNLIPVVCGLGLLGWLEVPLSVGTSIIGAMVLGLAVDDTAHVLGHIEDDRALDTSYSVVAGSLLLTSSALGLGFSLLTLSKLAVVATIGWTMMLTMGLALLADLIVLPSLLALAGFRLSDESPASASLQPPPTVISLRPTGAHRLPSNAAASRQFFDTRGGGTTSWQNTNESNDRYS